MRPLETVLLLADMVALVVLALPRLRVRPVRWAALAPLPVAIAQGVIEGPRWQLAPAYALAGLLPLVLLVRGPCRAGRLGRATAVALGAVGLAAAAALPAALPVFALPRPGGPFAIGTVTYHWVDADRQEIFSPDPAARRELMVQLWYPAVVDPSSAREPYVPDADTLSPGLARLARLPGFTFDHFRLVATDAVPSAPVAPAATAYPVLIFLEGLNGFRQMNTAQVEELVSHGYVVAAIDQPYAAASVRFPDGHHVTGLTKAIMEPFTAQSLAPVADAPVLQGRALPQGSMPYLARDVSFTLDRLAALDRHDPYGLLTGRLDLHRSGTFGMSLGAIVAGEACRTDPRLSACLMMDAAMPADVVRDGLRQPSMWITRDAATMRLERAEAGGWSEYDIAQTLTSMRTVFAACPPGQGYYVQIPGMFHVNFTDTPFYSPVARQLGFAGPIDARRGQTIVDAYSVAFFDRYLAGRPSDLLAGPSPRFPDVLVDVRGR